MKCYTYSLPPHTHIYTRVSEVEAKFRAAIFIAAIRPTYKMARKPIKDNKQKGNLSGDAINTHIHADTHASVK